MAAALAEGDEEPDLLAVIDAIIVDPVLEAPLAVGELRERRACQSLGIVDDLVEVELGLLRPVPRDDLGELLLGDVAGCELRAQVTEELHRQPYVLLDERHDGLVEPPRVVEFHRRDAQALGIDLRRVRRVRPRHPAADIGVVANRTGERHALALVKERLEDEDVREVHAAVERVVHDEHVARRHVLGEVAHDRLHRSRHGAEMRR